MSHVTPIGKPKGNSILFFVFMLIEIELCGLELCINQDLLGMVVHYRGDAYSCFVKAEKSFHKEYVKWLIMEGWMPLYEGVHAHLFNSMNLNLD